MIIEAMSEVEYSVRKDLNEDTLAQLAFDYKLDLHDDTSYDVFAHLNMWNRADEEEVSGEFIPDHLVTQLPPPIPPSEQLKKVINDFLGEDA